MTQIHHFDFRASSWVDISDALCEFRTMANSQSAYAYVKTTPGIQLGMIERLVTDLSLEDHICTEAVLPSIDCDVRHASMQMRPAKRAHGFRHFLEKIVSHHVPRPG